MLLIPSDSQHGIPQGCVLSPLLYTLYTSDLTPIHPSKATIKFADDTTVVGLIAGGDETASRGEIQELSEWCTMNNLTLNTAKTKEMVLDFRRRGKDHAPLAKGHVWSKWPLSSSWGLTYKQISSGQQTLQH